jgi:hypothetical protein
MNRKRATAVVSACLSVAACREQTTAPVEETLFVLIVPPAGTVAQCNSVQLHAMVSDGKGSTVVPDSVTWRSSDSVRGPISVTGLLTGLQPSAADTITAKAFARGLQAEAREVFQIQGTGGQQSCP